MAPSNITGKYPRTLQAADFTASNGASTIAVNSTTYTEIYYFKVPAKQRIAFGYGRIVGGVDDRGTYSIKIQNATPANIVGVARVMLKDANRVISRFVREDLSGDILNGTASKRVGIGGFEGNDPNPLTIGQDEFLALEYKSNSADTSTYANNTLQIPVTVWTLTAN